MFIPQRRKTLFLFLFNLSMTILLDTTAWRENLFLLLFNLPLTNLFNTKVRIVWSSVVPLVGNLY